MNHNIHTRQIRSYQEWSKHGDGGEEVPNVVVVEEWKQDAVPVVLTRLCWSFLCQQRETHSKLMPQRTGRYLVKIQTAIAPLRGLLTCQVLRPWKKKYSAKPHTTAVKRIHTNGRHLILSPLRSLTNTHKHTITILLDIQNLSAL